MKIGFTGTRKGINSHQHDSLIKFVRHLSLEETIEAHHGDCVGADAQFHQILILLQEEGRDIKIHIHPPNKEENRAFCKGADVIYEADGYLVRNENIVNNTDILIACPLENEEQQRGGTWYTVRYAREKNRFVYILRPYGAEVDQ